MAKRCERPGCSATGAVAYGMIPEDALFWIAALDDAPADDPNLLCVRHADAMIVPRGWTLDDRREDTLRLFKPVPADPDAASAVPERPRERRVLDPDHTPVQLVIDGTGEIGRPIVDDLDIGDELDDPDDSDERIAAETDPEPDAVPGSDVTPAAPWQPDFDHDDDLDGLLSVSSPLLARAFRGTDRPA